MKKGVIILITFLGIILTVFTIAMFAGFSARDRSILFGSFRTVIHDGINRSYLLSRPKSISADTRIIVGLHGFTDSPRRFAYYTGLHNVVSETDIVVYPKAIEPQEGQLPGWNAGFCCGSGWGQSTDDSGFIIAAVEAVKKEFKVESAEVFITGFSNGGFMTQRVAVDYPSEINGFAVSSASIGTEKNRLVPQKPVAALFMHGENDETVLFSGGAGKNEPDFVWLSFDEMVKAWKSVNKREKPLETIVYPETGHEWKDWRIVKFWHKTPDGSKKVMEFFDSL